MIYTHVLNSGPLGVRSPRTLIRAIQQKMHRFGRYTFIADDLFTPH